MPGVVTRQQWAADLEPVWLLSISFAGRAYRWSLYPVEPLDEDGSPVPHDGGLGGLNFSDRMELVASEPDLQSFPFELYFDGGVAELIEQGHDLGAATGELSLWAHGTAYEKRQVMLRGKVVNPEYGADDEPVRFSLEEQTYDDRSSLIDASAKLSADTWPDHHPDQEGRYYPIIIGTPGVVPGGVNVKGSPALIVDWDTGVSPERADKILIAGHRVRATQVTVYNASGTTISGTVTHEDDGLGRAVATIDISGAATSFRESATFYILWSHSSGGGLPKGASATLRGAGDVLEYILNRTTLDIDSGRVAAVASRLNGYPLSGYITEPASAWRYCVENLLPLLPVAIRTGPSGLYPVLFDWLATSGDAVEHITREPGTSREGLVMYDTQPSDVVNEVRFRYAYDAEASKHTVQTTLLGKKSFSGATDEVTSLIALTSLQRYSARVLELTSDLVYAKSTALYVAAWRVAKDGLLRRRVQYRTTRARAWLRAGDVVTLTDSELHLSNRVALVEEVRISSDDDLLLSLLLLEYPTRDSKTG